MLSDDCKSGCLGHPLFACPVEDLIGNKSHMLTHVHVDSAGRDRLDDIANEKLKIHLNS